MEWKADRMEDYEPESLDLDKLNLNEYSMNADLVKQLILSSHSACIKPDTSSESENTIQLNEDDLIDRSESLRALFQDFKDQNECIIDQSQGLFGTKNSKLSKSIQRKLINLNQCLAQGMSESTPGDLLDLMSTTVTTNQTNKLISQSLHNQEFKKKIFRLLRSIVERVLIDALSLYDQYINQIQQQELIFCHSTSLNSTTSSTMSNANLNNPTSKLWIEIRNRGCQFLGPQMQEDVLRLTLHALETVNRMSRKILVLYVVHMLKKHYPKASKTSVGHVIQLLYRAGCFKVEKRDNDSSLMELRKEFLKYPALRRQHDMQIIQIALESGIRMSPEQWSQKLFGDSTHKSEMQSIIDKIQSQQTIDKLIQDFFEKIQNGSQSSFGHQLEPHLNSLFMGAYADFSYFASINFEKKIVASQEKYKTKRNSLSLAESPPNIGSGGESMISEEDSDDFNFNDLCDFEPNESFVELKQAPQTKIVWSLLIDCLKRMTKILTIHLEYSSRLMSIIVSNQAKSHAIGKPAVAGVRSPNEPYQYSPKANLSINISGLMLNPMTSGQGYLMSMGPSAKLKPKFGQQKNKTKNFNVPSGDFRSSQSFNYSNSEMGLGLASKIWSDETVSMASNGSNGFNKKRLDFGTRNNFNYQDANFNDSNFFQGNNFGSAITDLNDQRRLKPELFYQPYSNYVEEKTCSYKFLKAFSYLPCFPSSWSQSTRGAIGFGIFLSFISLVIVALGLIPVYLTLGSNVDKNEFSIDIANGLKLQNQNLAGILSLTNEANRTLDQNITLTNEINSLMTQLTARFRNLNPNLEKIYNIRLSPDSDQSINVSYSIKTKPLTKSEMSDLQKRLNSMVNDQINFNQLSLTNSTISVNENINDIKISDPVVGEFQAKSSILLSNSKSSSLKSDSSSTGLGINGKKKSDLSEELKLIQSYSKIKFLKDGDDYMKKYPIYFPKYEPNYSPDEYQAYPEPYTEPYYPQEHDQYSKPKYQPDYTEPYYPQEHDQYSKPKYQPEYTEKYEPKPEKYDSYSKESHAHKKNEHKKKSKSKLKDEKPILKSETVKANSNKTHTELKKQRASAEATDVNDSEFDQSMQDSVEETKKESKVTKPIKEEIKLKSIEKLNEEDKTKNNENIKEKTKKIDPETILKILTGDESEKAVTQEEITSSTREIKITEKKISD